MNPGIASSLKLTAHGYMNITSTSNNTNKIATKKYLILKGRRAFPCPSMPHSNESNLIFVLLFGPSAWVANIVTPTKPSATKNINPMGRYWDRFELSINLKAAKFHVFSGLNEVFQR